MKIRNLLSVFGVILFSGFGCATFSPEKDRLPDPIAGDYDVISYETTECGRFGAMPMIGEAHFSDAGQYVIRMRPNWIHAPLNNPFIELVGSYYLRSGNKIKLYGYDQDNETWITGVTRYRVENRLEGKYVVLITELPKDYVKQELASLKGRYDQEARILRDKYRFGFEWVLKKK